MMENSFAFEQVECKYPTVSDTVAEFAEGCENRRWLIEWPDSRRETTIPGLAWYADEFDDEAEVTCL